MVGGELHWIGCQMGIAGGGLNLGVAEQFPDHRQSLAVGHRHRGEGVAQIMDADIVDAGALADALPWRLDVTLPVSDNERAMVRLMDNGPGMTPETLQTAVRAGWSGNNPVDNLGLFGMGFNIATARMGTMTEVWTTRAGDAEWHGVRIDFDLLRTQRTFKAPHLTKAKIEPSQHGTEIVISRLKPEQRAWLEVGQMGAG